MKSSLHIFYLFISLICYYLADINVPIELGILICIPYIISLVKSLRIVKYGFILPPFLLTCSNYIVIIIGTLPIKYKLFPVIDYIYGPFSESTLWKCIFISMIGITSCWIVFCMLNSFVKQSNSRENNEIVCLNPQSYFLLFPFLLLIAYFSVSGKLGYFTENKESNNLIEYIVKISDLIVCAFFLYRNNSSKKKMILFYGIIVFLSIVGAISGSKTLIIMPFLILSLTESFRTNVFFNKYTKLIPIIVFTAFIVMIPIRYVLRYNNDPMGSKEAATMVTEVAASSDQSVTGMVFSDFMARFNYVPVLASAIDYHGVLPHSVKNLWEYTLISPFYALLPRFLYPNKPKTDFANWYAYSVCHSTEDNNMSATYQGILYLSGGIIPVIMGFAIVGFVFFVIFILWVNYKHLYIYIVLLPTYIILPAEPLAFIASTIQIIIIYSILHKVIIKKEISR